MSCIPLRALQLVGQCPLQGAIASSALNRPLGDLIAPKVDEIDSSEAFNPYISLTAGERTLLTELWRCEKTSA